MRPKFSPSDLPGRQPRSWVKGMFQDVGHNINTISFCKQAVSTVAAWLCDTHFNGDSLILCSLRGHCNDLMLCLRRRRTRAPQTEDGGDGHVLPRPDIQPDGLWHPRLFVGKRYGATLRDLWCCRGDSGRCVQRSTLDVKGDRAVGPAVSVTPDRRSVQVTSVRTIR